MPKDCPQAPGLPWRFVLGFPALPFGDRVEDDPGAQLPVRCGVGPHEPRLPVRAEHVGGEPFNLWGDDACLGEGCADCIGAVGAVLAQGFAGPLPGDEAAAAEAQVFPVVGFGAAPAGP